MLLTIEIPQKLNRTYRLVSEHSAKEFLLYLEHLVKEESKFDSEIQGLAADREESVGTTPQKLRQNRNRK